MITAHLDAAVLNKVRLATSPAAEAMAWLFLTVNDHQHPIFGKPGAAARFAMRDPDVRLVASTLPSNANYKMDLLAPLPPLVPPDRVWPTQLEVMAETSVEDAASQVAQLDAPPKEVIAAAEAGTLASRFANGMSKFWSTAMADSWPGLKERLDADIAARARIMATEGIGSLLTSLHGDITWDGDTLRIATPWEQDGRPSDLTVTPVALTWPRFYIQLGDTENAVLYYPPPTLGSANTDPAAMAKLLGQTRAALLRDLEAPCTTTDLARRHGLAPATVSYHLSVLHSSGLISKSRAKRTVLYQRTDRFQ
ncbi:DNA-binding transcriptional ArsR family regulator [Actinokineospora baliensis]|uniref:ArsR/SmtB family transcription factor n=1 Tax=Actinokineospora baliensis TaxID=547056 RepID=UPI001957A375|nr:winged helix-turn-helix domain-containing protein [Actinokineospora baliensis]MBM7772065.1 DNA-binding transcriptional ArsR family regulator [Actinokineospora baliensis]